MCPHRLIIHYYHVIIDFNRQEDGNVSSQRYTKAQKVFEICSGRYETHKKVRKHQKVPFMLGKHFRSADIACWNKRERLFSNLRLLLGKPDITSDITPKFGNSAFLRILRLQNLIDIYKYQTIYIYKT